MINGCAREEFPGKDYLFPEWCPSLIRYSRAMVSPAGRAIFPALMTLADTGGFSDNMHAVAWGESI
jgi:hypothetical protein